METSSICSGWDEPTSRWRGSRSGLSLYDSAVRLYRRNRSHRSSLSAPSNGINFKYSFGKVSVRCHSEMIKSTSSTCSVKFQKPRYLNTALENMVAKIIFEKNRLLLSNIELITARRGVPDHVRSTTAYLFVVALTWVMEAETDHSVFVYISRDFVLVIIQVRSLPIGPYLECTWLIVRCFPCEVTRK